MPIHGRGPINVLVMHAEPLISLGVAAALREHEDLAVKTSSAQPTAVLNAALNSNNQPVNVVVTDHDSARALLQERQQQRLPSALEGARIIVLALQHREPEVRWALENGVSGYMAIRCSLLDLVNGVRAVDLGARYLCQTIARCLAESLMRDALTARELEVLSFLAHGHCNKQIASAMGLALGTVKAHMKGILGKLGAKSRMQALGIAVERGLVTELRMPNGDARTRSRARTTRGTSSWPIDASVPITTRDSLAATAVHTADASSARQPLAPVNET